MVVVVGAVVVVVGGRVVVVVLGGRVVVVVAGAVVVVVVGADVEVVVTVTAVVAVVELDDDDAESVVLVVTLTVVIVVNGAALAVDWTVAALIGASVMGATTALVGGRVATTTPGLGRVVVVDGFTGSSALRSPGRSTAPAAVTVLVTVVSPPGAGDCLVRTTVCELQAVKTTAAAASADVGTRNHRCGPAAPCPAILPPPPRGSV